MIKLYPFQERGLATGRAAYRDGAQSVLFVGPTGMGKTTIAAEAALGSVRRGRRVVAVAHRRELITQMAGRFDAMFRGAGLAVPVGYLGENPSAPVQVTSIQTILASRRMPPADFVIVDEAHHYVSDQWIMPLRIYLDQKARMMGLSATPARDDGRGLGRAEGGLFDVLVTVAQVSELVALNAAEYGKGITPIDVFAPSAHVRKLARWPHEEYLARAAGRSAVVFAPRVEDAEKFRTLFDEAGISVGIVHGELDARVRDEALASFASGAIKVLVNVNVLTEGWDAPICEVAILARKIGSLSLLIQMIGRARRPLYLGKRALLLDLSGNLEAHDFHPDDEIEYSLDGEAIRTKSAAGGRIPRVCRACRRILDDDIAAAKEAGAELTHCPECKVALSKVRALTPEEVELERFERDAARQRTPDDKRQKALRSLYLKGLRAGKKRTAAEFVFKKLFKVHPNTEQKVRAWREALAIVEEEKGDAWLPSEEATG